MTNLSHRLANGMLWAAVEGWGQQVTAFLAFVFLARLLGPEAYGLFGMAVIIPALGELVLLRAGWSEALVQRRSIDHEHVSTAFWFLLALSGAMALAAVASAPLLALVYDQPSVTSLVCVLALALPLTAVQAVPDALMRRELRFRPLALRTFAGTAVGSALALVLAVGGAGVWSLVALQLCQRTVAAFALLAATGWRPRLSVSRSHFNDLLAFSVSSLGERLLVFVNLVMPRFVIGALMGPTALGHFLLAWKIVELGIEALVMPFQRVAMPGFARLQSDFDRIEQLLVRGTRASAALAFPAFIGLAAIAPLAVPWAFGPQWTPSVGSLEILVVAGLVAPVSYFAAALMRGLGWIGWQLLVTALGTPLLAALLVLGAEMGLMAVAAAVVAHDLLMLPIRLFLVRRIVGVDSLKLIRAVCPVLAAALLVAATVWIWLAMAAELSDTLVLGAGVVLGAVAYAIALITFGRPVLADLRLLKGGPVLPPVQP